MSALPARFLGAWERRELVLGGAPEAGAGRAIWIEAGVAFVDVRGPGTQASDTSFAGTTSWDAPRLTWMHEIDRVLSDQGADVGRVTFDGDDLIEEGDSIAGWHIPYRERWSRLPGGIQPACAASGPGGLAVRVGPHEAAVVDGRAEGGAFAAVYRRFDGARWTTELAIGESTDDLPRPLEPHAVLPAGWSWR